MPFKDRATKRAYQREWIRKNAERHREQSRAGVKRWRVRHRDRQRAYRRAYYAGHRGHINALGAEWRRSHREMRNVMNARRRARLAAALGSFTAREWIALVEAYAGRCGYCRAEGHLQIDHRVPLCRGGTNAIDNIIPACAPCNASKGSLTEEEFRRRLGSGRRTGKLSSATDHGWVAQW